MSAIKTKRLTLKPLKPADVTKAYVVALNDKAVVRLTGAKYFHWDAKKLREYAISANTPGKSLLLGIFLKDNSRHIGNVRLFNFDKNVRRAELGIMIFDKREWGKGYAGEALKAVVRYGFTILGLHRIHADYYSNNKGSAKIFKRAGFQTEGVYRDHFILDGKFMDSIRIAKLNPKER